VVVLGAVAAFEAVLPLPAAATHLEENLRAAERLFDITDAKKPTLQPQKASKATPRLDTFDIVFDNVTFAYNRFEPAVLQDFELHVPQGSKMAITGPSGAGKTTIASLLMRFWAPQIGRVLLGGYDLQQFSQQELARHITFVPQHPYLFSGTIRDNLLLAKPNANEHELERACKKAQIHHLIATLSDGYDTWIGEHGLRLSGGERQRLALAQAFLRDTPIYVFDEPTAHVDGKMGKRIIEMIWELGRNKTVLLISHSVMDISSAQYTVEL
jgi:ATP-binding cassette subfamily C protein CydC